MQLIRGTDISLGNEIIHEVLIGQPTADGREYTLGIPKGDTHTWLDTKVQFFGRTWRTMGVPEEGIPANIPLGWGRNVRVKLCENAGGITVYEAESHAKHFYSMAEYKDQRGRTVDKIGAQPADAVTVLIYSCSETDGYRPRAGDIIVNGECGFVFDMTSEQAASASMAQFRQSYPDYAVAKTVSAERNGLLDDITITG